MITQFVGAQKMRDFKLESLHKKIDSSSFKSFKSKKVFYSDFGLNTGPFSIEFKDSLGNKRNLIYRNNSRPILGFGFSYKWVSIRIAFNLPWHLRSVGKFGTTKYLDLGFEFKTKKHFFDIDIHNYRGYAIKNAYKWNNSISKSQANQIVPQVSAFSLSVNSWHFFNKSIQISCLRGKTGMYLKDQYSFYIKTTANFHQIQNSSSLIPTELVIVSSGKTASNTFSALDFGFLPGYIVVKKHHNWQYSAMLGFGPVVQVKSYKIEENTRSFLGLAPRYDFRFMLGYNVDKWFLNLITEFDNKTIRFNDVRFRQTFYMVKLIGGIRIGKK